MARRRCVGSHRSRRSRARRLIALAVAATSPALAAPAHDVAAAAPAPATAACWDDRVDRAAALAARRPGTVAFALVDPDGRAWSYRGRRAFPSASLFKTTVMVAYLRRPNVRGRRLVSRERRLLAPMIRRSDDSTTNALVSRLEPEWLGSVARVSGQRGFVLSLPKWGNSQTTALDQAHLFAALERTLPARHRAYAQRLLRTVVPAQRWGIPRVAPGGWTVMFKGGWGAATGRVTSQAARLVRADVSWSVAVLTERNPSHAVGVASIEQIARTLIADGPCA